MLPRAGACANCGWLHVRALWYTWAATSAIWAAISTPARHKITVVLDLSRYNSEYMQGHDPGLNRPTSRVKVGQRLGEFTSRRSPECSGTMAILYACVMESQHDIHMAFWQAEAHLRMRRQRQLLSSLEKVHCGGSCGSASAAQETSPCPPPLAAHPYSSTLIV